MTWDINSRSASEYCIVDQTQFAVFSCCGECLHVYRSTTDTSFLLLFTFWNFTVAGVSAENTTHADVQYVAEKGSHIGTKAFLYQRSCISACEDNKLILLLYAQFLPVVGWNKPTGRKKITMFLYFELGKEKHYLEQKR